MKPISTYIELPLGNEIENRKEEIKHGVGGLGPADLIVLSKHAQDSKFSTFFYLSGYSFNSESDIQAYFKELSSKRPHKMLGKFQYLLSGMQIFIWNPFSF